MKPTFHAGLINGPFEDPCVYVGIIRERRALLFDIGSIGRLGAGNLMKVTDVFVTHTHIDHFIGFDTLLRVVLHRESPLRLYGPENIIRCVEGKLRGYTWNLIREYPLKIEVFEVRGPGLAHASFHAEHSFERRDHPITEFSGTLVSTSFFTVRGLQLSHQIPVMAYLLEEEFHININKAALTERGLPVGPWLSDLKRAIREGAPGETTFEVAGMRLALRDLMQIVSLTRGQKVAYVTDIAPTEENREKVIPFIRGADQLFCEAYFLERDSDRARERHHLTAALAGRIAREAEVAHLELMHFSPKYRYNEGEIHQEAMREFRGGERYA
ncbi:MAG: ribonuclease Z [Alphaproteobacteria bacterium]|uniref:Ribonuclease Z n=1 Tax=Candidatus Nitrobium versatile TaxID=2884831 RepID=A0A953LXX1_9BACT|nr:ribonuclease Z [Candidatus Nitrobium versatile]